MEYFKFGMETMRITQGPDGSTSHYKHSHGNPADYPIDVAGADGGQSAYFAMCDMKVVAIRGVGSKATNTIWLETTEKVQTPTFYDFAWIALTHWNDGSKTSKYKVGGIIKKGTIFTYEGTDGAKANHLHLVCGRGHCNNWVKNNKGSWVMQGESMSPNKVMYVDPLFTKIVSDGGLKFREVPKELPKTETTKTKVVSTNLWLMSLNNTKVCLMPRGATVTILQENYKVANGYKMDKVVYKDKTGMCANKYLK